MNYENMLWIDDKFFEAPDIPFKNFISPEVDRLTGPPRKKRKVTEIVIHETVTRSVPITLGVLKRRKLGVHFIVAPNGDVTQHGDLVLDRLPHAGSVHNPSSIGIEVVNPYYPQYNVEGPWNTVIDAHWAHKKKYVVPMADQAENTYQLIKRLLQLDLNRFNITNEWIGFNSKKKKLSMGRVLAARMRTSGIMAHMSFGHADGPWIMLYCILRELFDFGPIFAYNKAKILASRCKWVADLNNV